MRTTESSEDYLEAILRIRSERGSCHNVDIACLLGYSKASVTKALAGLSTAGLAEVVARDVRLTPEGERIARRTLGRHRFVGGPGPHFRAYTGAARLKMSTSIRSLRFSRSGSRIRFCSRVQLSAARGEPVAFIDLTRLSTVLLPRSYSSMASRLGLPALWRSTIFLLDSSVKCLGLGPVEAEPLRSGWDSMSLWAIVFPLVEYLGADDSRRWPSLASCTSIVRATPSGPGSSDSGPLLGPAGNPVVKKGQI